MGQSSWSATSRIISYSRTLMWPFWLTHSALASIIAGFSSGEPVFLRVLNVIGSAKPIALAGVLADVPVWRCGGAAVAHQFGQIRCGTGCATPPADCR